MLLQKVKNEFMFIVRIIIKVFNHALRVFITGAAAFRFATSKGKKVFFFFK